MALEGTLESFAISEIFQLISAQAKTGVLEIDTPEGLARIRFVNGQLLDATPAEPEANRSIGTMLVQAGLITNRQLEYALDVQKRNLRRLGDVLIRMGAIRTSEFQAMLALQRREMAYSLLRLRRGRYVFKNEVVDYEAGVDTLLNIDAILMEGSRQIDEWPALLKVIPSDGRVYRRTPGAVPVRELTEEEEVVLALLDGKRTVREIVFSSRLGEFPAWDALASLYNEGLASLVEPPKRTSLPSKAVPPSNRVPLAQDFIAAALLLAVSVVVLAAPVLLGSSGRAGFSQALSEARADLADIERRSAAWEAQGPAYWPALPPKTK